MARAAATKLHDRARTSHRRPADRRPGPRWPRAEGLVPSGDVMDEANVESAVADRDRRTRRHRCTSGITPPAVASPTHADEGGAASAGRLPTLHRAEPDLDVQRQPHPADAMSKNEPDETASARAHPEPRRRRVRGQIGQSRTPPRRRAFAGMTLTMARDLGSLASASTTRSRRACSRLDSLPASRKEFEDALTRTPLPEAHGSPDELRPPRGRHRRDPMLNGGTIRLDGGSGSRRR